MPKIRGILRVYGSVSRDVSRDASETLDDEKGEKKNTATIGGF